MINALNVLSVAVLATWLMHSEPFDWVENENPDREAVRALAVRGMRSM